MTSPESMEQFLKKAKEIKLQEEKKDSINEEILLFMKKNPVQKPAKTPPSFNVARFSSISHHFFKFKTSDIALASIILLLLAVKIASVEAESTIPGDFLYPMKLHFNEKIKESFAFSYEDKINLNVKLAQQRIQEAEKLMASGKIDSASKAQLTVNFKNRTSKIDGALNAGMQANLHNKQLEATLFGFEAFLRAHQQVLEKLQKDNPEHNIDALIQSVAEVNAKISGIRNNPHINTNTDAKTNLPVDKLSQDAALQAKIGEISATVNAIQTLIDQKKEALGNDAIARSKNNLKLVEEKIAEGKAKIEKDEHDYAGLITLLQEASIIAQESKYLLNEKINLGIDASVQIHLAP